MGAPGRACGTRPGGQAREAGSGARGPEGRALTSGKAPSAKTISSDVFPQPPSPTRTTLTDRAPCGASAPAAWAAFIASGGRTNGGQAGSGAGRAAGRPAGQECGRGGAAGGSARRAAGGGGGGGGARPGESPEAGRAAGPAPRETLLEPLRRGAQDGGPRSACVLGRAPGSDGETTRSRTMTVCGEGGQGKRRHLAHFPWEEGGGGQPGEPTALKGQELGPWCPAPVGPEQEPVTLGE